MKNRGDNLLVLVAGVALATVGACSAPGGPEAITDWHWGDAGSDPGSVTSSLTCTPAQGSLAMPARSIVMSAQAGGGDTKVFTEDLFNLFKGTCGGCHVAASIGNFHVTSQTFPTVVDQRAMDRVTSDDPTFYMPPAGAGGMPFSGRTQTDPVVQLAGLLKQWIAQGRPDELFTVSSGDSGGSQSYALSPRVGLSLTNIGDCVPGRALVGSSAGIVDQMDQFFAAAAVLPDTLDQTDLTTFDGTALAEARVIAYAPQYPLWSDDAGKLRHIRVPAGQSVKFHKDTQTFEIPPNTRFYKTFLKKVIDGDGNESYRKIETRLIVGRPDKQLPDGTFQSQALYGTYLWSEDEMSASLSNITLNDHTGFTDRVLEYTLDEPRAQMIIDSMPANLKYALEFGATGLKRHYGIPGSQRCVQCHMGSPSSDFVLGFNPLQVTRRADGTGGAYEATGPDEMTQLQRFIDYGIITGISSLSDILPLEQSEGTRKPRNDHELSAQAYMVGNCAHCHNPRGFPSVKSPALKDVLDFMPTPTGGVFQFPLGRVSPLRSRGIDQNVPIPYITPSLREYPVGPASTENWTIKWAQCITTDDAQVRLLCPNRNIGVAHLSAPWRSLVYRNVDTPFMYADDLAIFPHMPMNTPGYDCRVAPIMGDWMVSIPAARKSPNISEDAVPNGTGTNTYDTNPQPYLEVAPSDPGYPKALQDAQARLSFYHTSPRYGFCPDTTDIVDPAIIRAGGNYPIVPSTDAVYDPDNPSKMIQPGVGVPTHAHWVVTDITDPLGDWYPRRTLWNDVLVKDVVDMTDLPPNATDRAREIQARQDVLDQLQTSTLTQALKDFALTEMPFGRWQGKAACDFSSVPKVSQFTGDARPRWMNNVNVAADAPVYMQAPGAAVFSNICINCHGPQADAQGLLADAILNMTGGTGRVANFRNGLFGPVASPGSNRARVFDPFANLDPMRPPVVTGDDWAARYMAWMALGGTLVRIPTALLNIVATTRIVGASRSTRHMTATTSPNMLKLAKALCQQVLPADIANSVKVTLDAAFFSKGTFDWTEATSLIDTNGDAQMWQHLCSVGNRVVVRVPVAKWGTPEDPVIDPVASLYWGDAYPADAPVLDHRGHVTSGIQANNVFPMCFRKPANSEQLALADQYIAAHPVGGPSGPTIPYCPDILFSDPKWLLSSVVDPESSTYTLSDANRWAARGAINAGFSVFLYLDQLVKGKVSPKPQFDHCEQLTTK